jgi:ABC-type transport system substrate-binding protein
MGTVGGAAAAAAFLAACGGSDKPSGPKDRSGFLIKPVDQTSAAKRGGTLNIAGPTTTTLEQHLGGSGSLSFGAYVYSQLMRLKLGTYDEPPQGAAEPEFAESYEMSGDGLQVTFRLRGIKYDNRPPTNGRVSDSSDALYSWKRWETGNIRAPELANSASPDAPVLRAETPDARTIVFKLAFPFAPFLPYLSSPFFPFMYPKEADGGYDTRGTARGTGPWRFEEPAQPLKATLTRNPNYYDKAQPYYDTLNIHEITEPAAILAQLRSGGLDMNLGVLQEDVLALKKIKPDMVMYQKPVFEKGCGGVFFGFRQGSPFRDERVRKALSMGLDRTLWGDTYSNRKKFEDEGLPVEIKWMGGSGPGYHWYLDPEKNELGEASKLLHYNPGEAKKLLAASGLKLPINSTWHATPTGGGGANPLNEGMFGLFEQGGDFKFTRNIIADSTRFFAEVRDSGGNFDGVGIAFYNDHHDFDWTLALKYLPKSTDFWMKTLGEDPKMTEIFNRQRRELDIKKREKIFQEYSKYAVQQMYHLPHYPAGWKPYFIAQPWLGGWGWWQPYIEQYLQGAGQWYTSFWYDASKKTA